MAECWALLGWFYEETCLFSDNYMHSTSKKGTGVSIQRSIPDLALHVKVHFICTGHISA